MDNPLRNLGKLIEKFGQQIVESIDSPDPIIIQPYRGYANKERLYLKGRVLEDENFFRGKSTKQIHQVINNIKRFETDEVPEAKLKIRCNGQEFECITDYEGYFTLDVAWEAPVLEASNTWVPVTYELLTLRQDNGEKITATGMVYMPSSTADYGVITDIDDTILQTYVSSLFRLKMLYTTLVKDAKERLPVQGMVALFKAFEKGFDKKRTNPIFYISHSPWNIYDLLTAFLKLQGFPKGPVLLRDFGLRPSGNYKDHKLSAIRHLLQTYPDLPFIMLGDAAESDADFYIEIANEFPERIKAIYIRETRNKKNAVRIKKLIEQHGSVPAILIRSAEEIKANATLKKLI